MAGRALVSRCRRKWQDDEGPPDCAVSRQVVLHRDGGQVSPTWRAGARGAGYMRGVPSSGSTARSDYCDSTRAPAKFSASSSAAAGQGSAAQPVSPDCPARSPSSPERPAAKVAPTRCEWPARVADIIAPSTSQARCRSVCLITRHPPTISPRRSGSSKRPVKRILAAAVDTRDLDSLKAVVAQGVALFGRLDVIVANAGITSPAAWDEKHAGCLPGRDGRQRHRHVEHRDGRRAAHRGRRPRRIRDPDQFGSRYQVAAVHGALHHQQARGHRMAQHSPPS